MADVMSNSIAADNLAASASTKKQSELRFSNKYEPLLQNLKSTRYDKRETDVDTWYESRAKRMRISLDDMVNLEPEKSRNTKPNMTALAEKPLTLSSSDRESQKSLLAKYQTNEKILCSKSSHLSHNLKKTSPANYSPYSPTTQYTLKSLRNCNEISNVCSSESGKNSNAILESSENKSLPNSLQKEVKDPYEEFISTSKTPPPRLRCDASSGITPTEPSSNLLSKSAFKTFLSTPGYLANQYQTSPYSISTPVCSKNNSLATPPGSSMRTPFSCPGRIDSIIPSSSPKVRLSLSLDGKAELITEKSTSPIIQFSRPRSSSENLSFIKRKNKFRRSKSALLPCTHQIGVGYSNTSLVAGRPTGRSRDARSWAYCCKGELHNEFARQVENATLGSAVAAISLIRSTNSSFKISNPKAEIQPNKNIRSYSNEIDQSKLRNTTPTSLKLSNYNCDYVKDNLMTSPSGDSDKENWFPLLNSSPRRRPLPSSRQDKLSSPSKIIGDNHDFDFGIPRGRKRRSNEKFGDICKNHSQLKVVRGVEKLKNGEVTSCKTGDLGAIQGLLSLSQGNWR